MMTDCDRCDALETALDVVHYEHEQRRGFVYAITRALLLVLAELHTERAKRKLAEAQARQLAGVLARAYALSPSLLDKLRGRR